MPDSVSRFILKCASRVERYSAHLQGKGIGARSLAREVRSSASLLDVPPSLAIDIGGNVGNYSSELRSQFPELEIHVFEPARTNIHRLRERFTHDARIVIQPFALSNETGEASLYSDREGSGLASLTKRRLDHFSIAFDTEETIHTMRFEEYWCNELDRKPVDLVKIDVEGHELSVLEGMGDALKRTAIIQFEFGGCNIDTRTFFQDYWYFFKDNGFTLFRITPLGPLPLPKYRESDEFFTTTNYIARNNSRPS